MVTETRYFRNEQIEFPSGWFHDLLWLSKITTAKSVYKVTTGSYSTFGFGIQVFKMDATGSHTLISGGIVAVVNGNIGDVGYFLGQWTHDDIPLATTDRIMVRCYWQLDGGAWSYFDVDVITEQLGASQLDAGTWNVYYYLSTIKTIIEPIRTYVRLYYDGSYNTRIENFAWSFVAAVSIPIGGVTLQAKLQDII